MIRSDRLIKFKDGEEVFFECFFKENFPKFYAFTKRFVDDNFICEDIVQETFIAVWENTAQNYDSELMLNAFIYRTIRNKCINYLNHNRIRERYSRHCLKELENEDHMLSALLHEEIHALLYNAIRQLTPQCAIVIKLHLQGKKNDEIAHEMGISVITVKSHKLLAYKELRRILKTPPGLILLYIIKNIQKIPLLTHTISLLDCLPEKYSKKNGNSSGIHTHCPSDL